nr:hypothetical protein [Tanacetum cinerariifolium]
MSDLEYSTVTYTSISSDDGSLDVGSLRVIVYGYNGLPMMPEDLYAYVEVVMQEPPPLDFIPEPVYPEFMPPEDDVVPAEEQPLPAAVSPTADSSGYITKFDPEEDPKEQEDEDLEEDPADYLANRDDDEEEESSGGDVNDEEEDEGEDEEEEHLVLVDSVSPPIYRTTTRMSIRAQTHIPFSYEAEVDRILAIPTPPSSPLTSLSSSLPQIPYHFFYHHHLLLVLLILRHPWAIGQPGSGTPPLLAIPLPTSSSHFLLYKENVLEVVLLSQKRLCIALSPIYEVGESSAAPTARPIRGFRADYAFVGTLDAEIRYELNREIGYGITDVWEDLDEIAEQICDLR